jgi:crotonobetainyl-CoA:carnitine CoA-transferase CaiB-like acyl-CoA transferase
MTAEETGPLADIKVLDLTRVLSGPHVGRVLRDLGATVIKLEPPAGDLTRFAVPRVNSLSLYYVQQNFGKKNISIDVQTEQGRLLVRELAEHVDVVIENFKPGVADRLGIGFDDLRNRNRRLIYGTISGYGRENAWSDRRAYARPIHAELGLVLEDAMAMDRSPQHTVFAHGDLYPSLELVAGVLAALHVRDTVGEGQRVDVSMAQTMLYVNEFASINAANLGEDEERGTVGRGQDPIFRLKNGEFVTISGNPVNSGVFGVYRDMVGGELREDARFRTYEGRSENRRELLAAIQDWISRFENAEALEDELGDRAVASGTLRKPEDVAESAWARETGAFREVSDRAGGAIRVPAPPWRFSRSHVHTERDSLVSYRGEDNREILSGVVGLAANDIDQLTDEGVLSHRVPSSDIRQ